jgi:hypothetical protein
MEIIVIRTSDVTVALSKRCGKVQAFGGAVLSYDVNCHPPISGNRVLIRLHGNNVTLILCEVGVITVGM